MKNSLLKILITGGNGQLAHALSHHARAREFQLTACTRQDLDITQMTSISDAIAKHTPDIIINTAAYTAVDKAEKEPEEAMRINHQGVENLAITCKYHHTPLIHLSTDYVFDGQKTSPYRENDSVNPINLYGKSKWLGEQAIRQQLEQHIILRVSGMFSEHGINFFNTINQLDKNKADIRVVADQFICPTYAGDIANILFTLAKKTTHWGTYHYCSQPVTTWHQFAEAILHHPVRAVTSDEYPTVAKRPLYSVLECSKIATDYGITQPSWEHAIWDLQ